MRLVEPAAFTKISALGVEEQRVNVVADIITPVAERASLGDNFRVEARVIVWETENTLKVPVSALFRRGDESAAYVVRGGKAVLVPVEAGRSSGSEVQVLKGLTAGDDQLSDAHGDQACGDVCQRPQVAMDTGGIQCLHLAQPAASAFGKHNAWDLHALMLAFELRQHARRDGFADAAFFTADEMDVCHGCWVGDCSRVISRRRAIGDK